MAGLSTSLRGKIYWNSVPAEAIRVVAAAIKNPRLSLQCCFRIG